jgi:alpha-tubulin suppressor-like RCC1 family protein
LTGIVEVGTGGGSTCSVATSGEVKCWGATVYGATAQTTPAAPTPTTVAGLPANAIKHVEMTNWWTTVQDGSGNTWSWGSASSGEMGDGSSDGASCPNLGKCRFVVSAIANLAGSKLVAAGQGAGVALKPDGAVVAWGGNTSEALGHTPGTMGDTTCAADACNPTPVVVKMP